MLTRRDIKACCSARLVNHSPQIAIAIDAVSSAVSDGRLDDPAPQISNTVDLIDASMDDNASE
jgi:hypothetical protein